MRLRHYPQYTVEEYQQWKGDWELIDGLPFSKLPSFDFPHQNTLGELLSHIYERLESHTDNCKKCLIIHSLDWIVDNTTVLCPDLSVICERPDQYIVTPPVMIIEAISPSSSFKDRTIKYEIYEEKGVKYYLIVDPERKTYQAFQLIDKKYQEQNDLHTFIIHEGCNIQLDIAEILAGL